MAEKKEGDNDTKSEETAVAPRPASSEQDSSAPSDKPPSPPKRDYPVESTDTQKDSHDDEYASVKKRKKLGSFPTRPEFVYKPENPEARMGCISKILVVINLFIWLFGAVITAIGIWINVDHDFLDIQTNLDMKQFTTASYVLIVVGVLVMLIGFCGCYGVIASKMCMLIIFSVVVIIIILLELTVMGIVWTATSNKSFKEDVKLKATIAMQGMIKDSKKAYFFNLLQTKLKCCGVNGKEDYSKDEKNPEPLPNSCMSEETAQPYERGCYDSVIEYLKAKAAIVGGVAVAIFLLQLGLLSFTICFMCGIRRSADSIF